MNNLMVTISGGRSSGMMARHIQTNEKYKNFKKIYVFCNTGMERPETIQFLKNIENYWKIPLIKIEGLFSNEMNTGVNYKIVQWEEINMNALPFTQAIIHKNKGIYKGLPNSAAPYCSEMLKTLPSKKLCDDIFGVNNYIKAIGFRKEDMPKRINLAEIKLDKKRIFPLLTDFNTPISQIDLNKWWDKQKFKLSIHNKFGNCELCWKKSNNNLIENIRYGTRFIEWYKEQEKNYGNTSFRGKKSINYFVKISKMAYTPELNFNNDNDNDNCVCNF
jgi:Phosphoadenosine phosphosulfate reductase family